MENSTSSAPPAEPQAPEILKPRTDDSTLPVEPPAAAGKSSKPAGGKPGKRQSYRPSHRATFIGIAVVIVILAINAVILGFVLKGKSKTIGLGVNGKVTLSQGVLNQIGVNSSSIGNSADELIVVPNSQFKGKLTVAGDTTVGGQLKLNNKLTGSDASLTQLEAGNVSLSQLNVSGSSTLSGLNLRNNLAVLGTTQLQGAVTINQLLTVNNSLTVTGNLAIGGTFSARSLASISTLTVGGHIITTGPAPGVGPGGSALGSNGTVSISGNDSAGRIAINIGTGASSGTLANVAFRTEYGNIPRVIISPIGVAANFYITNVSVGGFSVAVGSGLSPGGYGIDYIVEQ
jgi:hypothetical protein